jgi:glycosyltransferase involved in cell wall biosynthesis
MYGLANDWRSLARIGNFSAGRLAGALMPLTVLSVSYSLAHVSRKTAGGAEQVLATIDEALVRAGHRSVVLAPAGSRCNGLLIPAQIPRGVLDEDAKHEARKTFKHQIDRILNEFSVDLVHMHGLDFHHYLPSRQIPILISLHLPLSWYAVDALCGLASNVTLVAVSDSQARTAPGGVRIDAVIKNGVDLSHFRPQKRKSNYALVIARVCPEKGLHLAIDAAERAGVTLIIAGSVFDYSEHRDYFDSMILPRLNERIRFIGLVGGGRKANLLAGARCLLVPSLAPETSSLVAMEAMASGTAVVAFPGGALREVVTDRRTGFLVNDAEEMADAIVECDSIAPETCRIEAEKKFSSTRMFSEYLDLYRSATSSEIEAHLQTV